MVASGRRPQCVSDLLEQDRAQARFHFPEMSSTNLGVSVSFKCQGTLAYMMVFVSLFSSVGQ